MPLQPFRFRSTSCDKYKFMQLNVLKYSKLLMYFFFFSFCLYFFTDAFHSHTEKLAKQSACLQILKAKVIFNLYGCITKCYDIYKR